MKKLELQNFGVKEMSTEETMILNGGAMDVNGGIDLGKLLKGSAGSFVLTQVISHWSEIKSGLAAGYNAKY